jgi:ribonuclease PH
MRVDGRASNQLRKVNITPNYSLYAEGSVLIEVGNTRVLCNATLEDDIPHWMKKDGNKSGWVTAEYAMLPRATIERTNREKFGPTGRSQEIKRLIGRSLRMAVDLSKLNRHTCIIDCDVLQADGGTRTASITGGYLALAIAINKYIQKGIFPSDVMLNQVAAVSAGVIEGKPVLDLNYAEDHIAEVDANIVMTDKGHYIEVQSTAEGEFFSQGMLDNILQLAHEGINQLLDKQRGILNKMQ